MAGLKPYKPPTKPNVGPPVDDGPKDENIYEVTFRGEYWTTKKGETSTYEFTVKMDGEAKKLGFLHIFARHILTDRDFIEYVAKAKYPDWKRHRTHIEDGGVVIDLKTGERKAVNDLALMNYRQLCAYIEAKGIGIETDLFPLVNELRQALKDYRDNREAFLTHQAKRQELMGRKLSVKKTIKDLNIWKAGVVEFKTPDTLVKAEETPAELSGIVYPEDLEKEDAINMAMEDLV